MRAMRLVQFGVPLLLQEIALPDLEPDWVLIEVRAAGLCHTDLSLMDGVQFRTRFGRDYSTQLPLTLGHEVSGVLVQVGPEVDALSVGDRVAAAGRRLPGFTPGLHIDGGFAEYCAVPAVQVMRIPDAVSFESAAVATDSVLTAYSAVRTVGEVKAGETVGIVGLGGLGLNGVRSAVLAGASVAGVDQNPGTFSGALEAGASSCWSSIQDLAELVPSLIVDFVGSAETVRASVDVVQAGGRVVVVGLSNQSIELDGYALVLGRKSLLGSIGHQSESEFAEVLEYLERGEIRPKTEVVDFSGLNEAFDRLRRGEVHGRLVTVPTC
jgi:propanol-preferring alcohol dehydrogenase